MRELAVFYHVGASWDRRHSDRPVTGHWRTILRDQAAQWTESGLLAAADRFVVGVSGTEDEAMEVRGLLPAKAMVMCHGQGAHWEIPTLEQVRMHAKTNPEAHVFYHHTKGASDDSLINRVWRFEMQHFTVRKWRDCVDLLRKGYDLVGCHWLSPEGYPTMVQKPFFGGTFWWARASYLAGLASCEVKFEDDGPFGPGGGRFAAERWIGTGVGRPGGVEIYDWSPGWPSIPLCSRVLKEYT